ILGDVDDPKELDEETTLNSPFVYMSRPVDIQKFPRVLIAGLESPEAMIAALASPTSTTTTTIVVDEMGPVPAFADINAATSIIDTLLQDLGAMAIILASRAGETLLERGAVGYIDRDALAGAMVPVM